MAPEATARPPHRLWVISALGIVQIFTWGTSFYLPAVFAGPIAEETGWPLSWVVGGLSIGLLAAAVASPYVGATIHHRGGRPVLALAALLLSAGLATLAVAPALPVYLAGWFLLGLGMGCGLYDPAFATLGRLYGSEARPAITTLTLWGGFASTVCWPLSAFLVQHFGWRGACLAYAGLHLVITLPLVLLFIPKPPAPAVEATKGPDITAPLTGRDRLLFLLFGGVLVIGGVIMTMVSVHLIVLLQARDVPLAAAVSFGALIGPAQVGARVVEMSLKGRHHPLWTLTAAFGLIAMGLLLLALGLPWVSLWLVLYGAGNGIYSISRGTVPLALFGPARYPVLVGRLARPGLIAQALAPSIGALVLTNAGADALLWALLGLALVNLVVIGGLWRFR
ncbi:MFS transporter [Enterovirga rhinocerotis]|uniref:Putative MFS family arabinose efflux permease n=1 Tax=Enterovirga rhinocerotis TaxID=1339210 RepID=A0A4R7C3K3_9HYPH|nr:MFS transporter [Enterovirga rhinocerotis]TDR93070.1 putative MFS family arabinose efflux permease [Enterovirga rhinocerotis]